MDRELFEHFLIISKDTYSNSFTRLKRATIDPRAPYIDKQVFY